MESKIYLESEDKDNFYFTIDRDLLDKIKDKECYIYFDDESQKVKFVFYGGCFNEKS